MLLVIGLVAILTALSYLRDYQEPLDRSLLRAEHTASWARRRGAQGRALLDSRR